MLRINGLPMYSEIKHIYCNTEIRPTRKEKKTNVYCVSKKTTMTFYAITSMHINRF